MPSFIAHIERKYSPRVPAKSPGLKSRKNLLPDGKRIIIVGGGISGSSLARELLTIAAKENVSIQIFLINSNTCNYCGGLITNLAQNTLQNNYALTIPPKLVLKEISTCLYLTTEGHVNVDLGKKLIATLRTSKFGIQGFDDSIKSRIAEGLDPKWAKQLKIYEPTIVTKIVKPEQNTGLWKVVLSRKDENHRPIVVEGDILVMATGFKSLNKPMMLDFQKQTGYVPPPLMPAGVTEIDTSSALKNKITDQMLIIDHVVPDAVVALIPKANNWLTLTSLGKKLNPADIDLLFDAEPVREFIELPSASKHLRCQTICPAQVFTGPSSKFYGERWVAIGDLTGYGRVLKDGYFASFLESQLVAETIFYHGASEQHFKEHYHAKLKCFTHDNRFGMFLFRLNLMLGKYKWFRRLLIAVGQLEEEKGKYGSFFHSAIRALATGDLNYRLITSFFIIGCLQALLSPVALWKKSRLARSASIRLFGGD
ncbi:hypothetical protein [Zhaonella formicivorans]|uniref:hypothetical protein n=1 Tax=Zhaonella formicivorans TaxID=2528593 RepID=UPI0010E777D0|nr:hypothetical protein [Zhaonella formicivorans]